MISEALLRDLQALEEGLLHQPHERSQLEALLAADFLEVDGRGHISSREQVISWLLGKPPQARWALSEFQGRELAPGLVQILYHAVQVMPPRPQSRGAQHSSLWRFTEGGWQLLFHQASKLPTPERSE